MKRQTVHNLTVFLVLIAMLVLKVVFVAIPIVIIVGVCKFLFF